MFLRHFLAGAALLAAAHSPALAAWSEAKTKHFIIYSEQKPDELKAFAERLERYDQVVRRVRAMKDPQLQDSGRLTLYVMRDQRVIEDFLGGRGVAGVYFSRASGAVSFVHRDRADKRTGAIDSQSVFFHEYFHHLMLADNKLALPHWLVEGMAEFFGTAEVTDKGDVEIGHVPQHRAYGLFNFNHLTTQQMVGATLDKMNAEQVELSYGRGWLLSHYLMFEPSRRGQLDKYVMGIQQGKSALDSAVAAFGDLKQLDRELNAYLGNKKFRGTTFTGDRINPGPIAIRPLDAGESAIMRVRMRSDRGVDKRSAPGVARDARDVAARFPNHARVLAALAEAEHDAENYAAASAAADRALAIDPNNSHALIYKGRALMEAGRKDRSKADWKSARTFLSRANRLDPDDAEPLMLFYRTYLYEEVAPTKNAKDGLYYAHMLMPQDSSLRMMVVEQLISDSQFAAARKLFAPIAFNPHAGDKRQRYAEIMSALEASNGKKAQELLRADEKEEEAKRRS